VNGREPHSEGPGLAAARPGRRRRTVERFRGLLREAARDPAAAAELTMGYVALAASERQALRRAVEEDATGLGVDLGDLLACWGALEQAVPRVRRPWRAWVRGDSVVFAAPGRGALEAAPGARIRLHGEGWAPGPEHRAVEVEEAVDHLATVLWAARREGRPLPRRLGAFADLFDR